MLIISNYPPSRITFKGQEEKPSTRPSSSSPVSSSPQRLTVDSIILTDFPDPLSAPETDPTAEKEPGYRDWLEVYRKKFHATFGTSGNRPADFKTWLSQKYSSKEQPLGVLRQFEKEIGKEINQLKRDAEIIENLKKEREKQNRENNKNRTFSYCNIAPYDYKLWHNCAGGDLKKIPLVDQALDIIKAFTTRTD